MDKLNNEDLNKVSAGTDGKDLPTLEEAAQWLYSYGGYCVSCGCPVTEMTPRQGPDFAGYGDYTYIFNCKCQGPAPWDGVYVTYDSVFKKWWSSSIHH